MPTGKKQTNVGWDDSEKIGKIKGELNIIETCNIRLQTIDMISNCSFLAKAERNIYTRYEK